MLKDLKEKNIIFEILDFIKEQRFVSEIELDSFLWKKYHEGDHNIFMKAMDANDTILRAGLIRSRLEITRSGKQFIKDNYTEEEINSLKKTIKKINNLRKP